MVVVRSTEPFLNKKMSKQWAIPINKKINIFFVNSRKSMSLKGLWSLII